MILSRDLREFNVVDRLTEKKIVTKPYSILCLSAPVAFKAHKGSTMSELTTATSQLTNDENSVPRIHFNAQWFGRPALLLQFGSVPLMFLNPVLAMAGHIVREHKLPCSELD